MEKAMIIVAIALLVVFVGVLYGKWVPGGEKEELTVEEAYTAYLPDPLPEIDVDPMVGFPLY